MLSIVKCRIISITNKSNVIKGKCKIAGTTSKRSNREKYLGVTITNKLSWLPNRNKVTYQLRKS